MSDASAMLSAASIPRESIAYTEIGKLKGLQDGSESSLEQAAKQFESVFVGLWLKTMRDASAVFSEGNYLSSHAVDMHQEMLDNQWAIHLSESGGIGLAEIIKRQLAGEPTPVQRESLSPTPATRAEPLVDLEAEPAPLETPPIVAQAVPATQTPELDVPPQAAVGAVRPQTDNRADFVSQIGSAARNILEGSGLPVLGVLAQAVLETGWGQHVPHDAAGASSHNLFGIKASADDPHTVRVPTKEYELGRFVDREASFRAYDDVEAAIEDLVAVLKNRPRYSQVFDRLSEAAGDVLSQVAAFAEGLQAAGYATDPNYADKVRNVANTILDNYGAP